MQNHTNNPTYAVGKVNNVPIVYINDENRNVPINPICDALGIDANGQIQKIKRHKILSSTTCMIHAVGADNKNREMVCLPYKYIFGWLFSIDISRVAPEAAEAVERYQNECYDVLYQHFVEHKQYVEEKQADTEVYLSVVENAKKDFRNARNVLAEAERGLQQVRKLTFQDWKDSKRVQKLPLVFND